MDNKTDLQTLASRFQEGFAERWTSFEKHESWRDIFTIYPSRHAEETDEDGEEITHYVHKTHALGFTLSQEKAQQGWTEDLKKQCDTLFKSFTHQIEEAAFSAFDEVLTSDKFEKNRQHEVFSRNAFNNVLDSLAKAKNASGLSVDLKPKILLVPVALQFKVYEELPKAELDLPGMKMLINPSLNNPSAWFLITDAPHGFKCFERKTAESEVYASPSLLLKFEDDKINTEDIPEITFEIEARYSFGCTNPNAVFASTGTGVSK